MRSLTTKLTLAFLLVSLIGIVIVAILANRFVRTASGDFEDEFSRSLLLEQLVAEYEQEGKWPRRDQIPPHLRRSPLPFAVVDAAGKKVLFETGRVPAGLELMKSIASGTPIVINDEIVGILVTPPVEIPDQIQQELSRARRTFLNGVRSTLLWGVVGAGVLSLGIGVVVAQSLTRPIQELTSATHVVAQGELGEQVPIRSDDELGALAASFNQMSAELAHQRDLRRQMTADIAHDLRTPLSVILGHAEGLRDGILPAEQGTFNLIHEESLRLNRLIDDLRTLSLADAGELPLVRRRIDPRQLLERTLAAHAPQAETNEIALTLSVVASIDPIEVDPDRIKQVLDNLISNALRFTPRGGEVKLSANGTLSALHLTVKDSGKGIAADELPHIFSRFYRGDKSRQRDGAGSGLGLAISKSIVEQHGGTISATSIYSGSTESELNRGTTFTITLPRLNNPQTTSS